jgi:hypothetical protein
MGFEEELAEIAPEMVNTLLHLVKRLYPRDPTLAEQLLKSSRLIAKRLDEARWHPEPRREQMLDEAAGAIAEAHTALYLAESFGHVDGSTLEPAQRSLNHALAMLGAREHALLPAVSDTH